MKIVEVNTYHVRPRWGFVEILTDEGLSGWGEAAVFNWKTCILLAIFLPAVFLLKKHPILYIGVGAVAGILLRL